MLCVTENIKSACDYADGSLRMRSCLSRYDFSISQKMAFLSEQVRSDCGVSRDGSNAKKI